MAYTKTTWLNNDPLTPLNDVNMNKIEDGIEGAHNTADANATSIAGYNNWRAITTDPGAPIVAAEKDNIMIAFGANSAVLLPASPTIGAKIRIVDAGTDFNSHNLTVQRNGNNIRGAASDYVFTTTNGCIEFVWSNSSFGWVPIT